MKQEETLTTFIKENQERLYCLAYTYLKNAEDAKDALGEAIVKSFAKQHTLKNQNHIKPWFYRILINESITILRKSKHVVPVDQIPEQVDSPYIDNVEKLDLFQAVDRLTPKFKTVIVLRFFEDMTLKEIATLTGCTLSTAKARLYRALSILKVDLSEEREEFYE